VEMLMQFDPFRDVDRLTQEILGRTRTSPGMPMDAYRRGDEFVVSFDLPGFDSDSIDLTVEKNVLTVKAERRFNPGDGVEVLVSERPQGTFERRVFVGEALDLDRLQAHYENGVLSVVIPVAESAKPRKVEISEGSGRTAIEAEAHPAA
jgi:HSP20 family protein